MADVFTGFERRYSLTRTIGVEVVSPIAPAPGTITVQKIQRDSRFWTETDGSLVEYDPAIIEVWGRPRITMEGKDLTWHTSPDGRSFPTVLLSVGLVDPFTYGSLTLVFPGFDRHADTVGTGRWAFVREGTNVRVQVVGDGDTSPDDLETMFRGHITGHRETTQGLEVACEGRLFTSSHQVVPPQTGVVERMLVEDYCEKVLNRARRGRYLPMRKDIPGGSTGIYYSARGDWSSPLAAVTDALAVAIESTGTAYTIRYDEIAGPEFTVQEPRNTWTIYNGQPGAEIDLTTDLRARVDVVYGEGMNERGGYWRNTKYPSADIGDAPAYPGGASTYGPGATIPANIARPFWQRMRANGYRIQSSNTGYNASDRIDVEDLQREAGVTVNGLISGQTWAAAFAPGRGSTLGDSFIYPLAARIWWDRWKRNASGSITGKNPAYKNERIPVERHVVFPDGTTRKDARRSARQMLERESEPLVSGTVVLTADPREGSRFRIREGDMFRIQGWHGETLDLHISRLDIDLASLTTTLTVTSRYGTYVTLAEEAANRREARQSRRRSNGLPVRSPGIVWDTESPAGVIATTSHSVESGSVTYVPMPYWGQVVRTRIECDGESEFIAAVFDRKVTVRQIQNIIGGNPITANVETRLGQDPTRTKMKALRQAGLVIWWGSASNPLGYGSEQKPFVPEEPIAPEPGAPPETVALYDELVADRAAAIAAVTELLDGTFEEDASWDFRCHKGRQYLTLVTWTKSAVNVSGRFLPAPMDL